MCPPQDIPFGFIGHVPVDAILWPVEDLVWEELFADDFSDGEVEPPAPLTNIPNLEERQATWFMLWHAPQPAKEKNFTVLTAAHVMWTNGMSGIAQWTRGIEADEVDALDFDRNTEVMVYSGQYFTGYNARPFTQMPTPPADEECMCLGQFGPICEICGKSPM
jgi:hypothetical protein